jgi:hypothetical protein
MLREASARAAAGCGGQVTVAVPSSAAGVGNQAGRWQAAVSGLGQESARWRLSRDQTVEAEQFVLDGQLFDTREPRFGGVAAERVRSHDSAGTG